MHYQGVLYLAGSSVPIGFLCEGLCKHSGCQITIPRMPALMVGNNLDVLPNRCAGIKIRSRSAAGGPSRFSNHPRSSRWERYRSHSLSSTGRRSIPVAGEWRGRPWRNTDFPGQRDGSARELGVDARSYCAEGTALGGTPLKYWPGLLNAVAGSEWQIQSGTRAGPPVFVKRVGTSDDNKGVPALLVPCLSHVP